MPPRLTKEQAAIISAYTGIAAVGEFKHLHEYAELVLGRPVMTHEFACEEFTRELKGASLKDFTSIAYIGE